MSNPTISNIHEPQTPLIAINLPHHFTVKLTPTNYLTWKLQFESLLIGYSLEGYVDGTVTPPASTIVKDGADSPNPAYQTWHRQDKLIFGAIVGSLSPTVAPLLIRATSSRDAWMILANTYAEPSRRHIKQIKDQIKHPVQGTRTISDYMQFIRTRADELAILGKPVDEEDLIEKVLDGLDPAYKSIVDAVNARDSPISFHELHEKLCWETQSNNCGYRSMMKEKEHCQS